MTVLERHCEQLRNRARRLDGDLVISTDEHVTWVENAICGNTSLVEIQLVCHFNRHRHNDNPNQNATGAGGGGVSRIPKGLLTFVEENRSLQSLSLEFLTTARPTTTAENQNDENDQDDSGESLVEEAAFAFIQAACRNASVMQFKFLGGPIKVASLAYLFQHSKTISFVTFKAQCSFVNPHRPRAEHRTLARAIRTNRTLRYMTVGDETATILLRHLRHSPLLQFLSLCCLNDRISRDLYHLLTCRRSRVKDLTLDNVQINCPTICWTRLTRALQRRWKRLDSFVILGSCIPEASCVSLAKYFRYKSNLRAFWCPFVVVPNTDCLVRMLQGIRKNKSIEELGLTLSRNQIEQHTDILDEFSRIFQERQFKVVSLKMEHESATSRIIPALTHQTTLTKLCMFGGGDEYDPDGSLVGSLMMQALPHATLHSLLLHGTRITTEGARCVARFLERDACALTELKLEFCTMKDDDGLAEIIKALEINTSLRVLKLRGPNPNKQFGHVACRALIRSLPHMKGLRTLILPLEAHCTALLPLLAKSLDKNTSVLDLQLLGHLQVTRTFNQQLSFYSLRNRSLEAIKTLEPAGVWPHLIRWFLSPSKTGGDQQAGLAMVAYVLRSGQATLMDALLLRQSSVVTSQSH